MHKKDGTNRKRTSEADSDLPANFVDPRVFNLTKPTYSINEMIEGGPFKRTALYKAIKEKRLRTVKAGKKRIALAPDYAAFLASLRPDAA
jgi:hypothetical protein